MKPKWPLKDKILAILGYFWTLNGHFEMKNDNLKNRHTQSLETYFIPSHAEPKHSHIYIYICIYTPLAPSNSFNTPFYTKPEKKFGYKIMSNSNHQIQWNKNMSVILHYNTGPVSVEVILFISSNFPTLHLSR